MKYPTLLSVLTVLAATLSGCAYTEIDNTYTANGDSNNFQTT